MSFPGDATQDRTSIRTDRFLGRESLDRSGMLGLVSGFPDQCRKAVEIGGGFEPVGSLASPGRFQNIVVLGMGGSAVGGDLLRVLLDAEGATAPVIVCRDYRCPGFVGPNTLCIAASYSGNTEETLAATNDALARGASILPVTTGGTLAALARDRQIPYITIPSGQPPRSALGYMFLPALIALSRLGHCRDFSADILESIARMEELAADCAPEVESERNQAKQIALSLDKRTGVFYGSSPAMGVVAFRWKCQFNENAKCHAFWNQLPELDHNEICAWRSESAFSRLRWVFLRDRQEPQRIARRVDVTRSILASKCLGCTDVWGRGDSLLSRMLTAILLGDYVSTYAALLRGVDPTDIREIDVLKDELAAS